MNGFNNFKGQEEGPQTTTVPFVNNHVVSITTGSFTLHPFICVLSCALGRDINVKKGRSFALGGMQPSEGEQMVSLPSQHGAQRAAIQRYKL